MPALFAAYGASGMLNSDANQLLGAWHTHAKNGRIFYPIHYLFLSPSSNPFSFIFLSFSIASCIFSGGSCCSRDVPGCSLQGIFDLKKTEESGTLQKLRSATECNSGSCILMSLWGALPRVAVCCAEPPSEYLPRTHPMRYIHIYIYVFLVLVHPVRTVSTRSHS